MRCPACWAELGQRRVGDVTVDVCGGCGGVWFDANELKKVDDAQEAAGEGLLALPREPGRPLLQGRRSCTKCPERFPLMTRPFPQAVQVKIEECPGCGGNWLDAGELDAIRARPVRQAPAPPKPLSAEAIAAFEAERVRSHNERSYSLGGLLRWLHRAD